MRAGARRAVKETLSVAKTQSCQCGQVLDIEDFQPGDSIQCPSCDAVLTIPAAEPVMAMAVPVEDDEDTHASAQKYISPLKRRQQAERRSRYASQARLKRVMIWPCLVLGLASFGVAGLGIMWAVAPQTIEIVNENGMDVVYANIETQRRSGTFERINVKPSLVPADYLSMRDGSPYYTYNGAAPWRKGNAYVVLSDEGRKVLEAVAPMREMVDPQTGRLNKDAKEIVKDKCIRLKQSGFWFYEVDEANKPIRKLNDMMMMAQRRGGGFAIVKYHGPDDFRTPEGKKVQVAYYKAEAEVLTNPLGKFKLSGAPMGLEPAFFIWSGLAIGLVLVAAGGFFIYECHFSKAAKAAKEKRKAEEAADQAAA